MLQNSHIKYNVSPKIQKGELAFKNLSRINNIK